MHLVFIDDSQQQDPPRQGLGHLLAIGAVVIPEQQLSKYASAQAAIRTKFAVPDSEEIKWKLSRGSYLANAGRETVYALRAAMLQAANQHDVKSIVVIVDHSAAYKTRTQTEVGREILRWLSNASRCCPTTTKTSAS